MLVSQTAINLAANVFSAAFGLVNVVLFTRLLAPSEFGSYVLGLGFAQIVSTFMATWLRLPIMREYARDDGSDVRGVILPGLLLSCLLAPIAYVAAPAVGLSAAPAWAAAGLALAMCAFETGQELLRARLRAYVVMKATMMRAVLVSALGIAFAVIGHSGVALLVAAASGYLLTMFAFNRPAWSGTVIQFDGPRLLGMVTAGIPLTASLTLLMFSGVIDRFIIAHLAGAGSAGQYAAGVDLVRQALTIPAISAAAAFFPLAVQIHANRDAEAVRSHLGDSFEFLSAATLPACLGYAAMSGHIANVVLGAGFRDTATTVMPVVSVAVIFQILSYQYLHMSFLLSERNSFYLWNTATTLLFNAAASYFLIEYYGTAGAAWARLAADIFGFLSALVLTRWAYPMPMPMRPLVRIAVAAIAMTVVVKGLDAVLTLSDGIALVVLIPIGAACYFVIAWLLDVAKLRGRLRRGLTMAGNSLRPLRFGGLRS
jgi:O-antigen/teichoic acid export membrane protein